jgi:hypothetical protein
MTQRQLIYTVLAIVLVPLLLIVGYNALVVQPSLAETQAEGRGLNFPTEVQDLRVSGDAEFAKDLSVVGDITASSIVTDGAATLTTLNVSGATVLDGGLTMDTSAFTVADTSGNVATAGTLSVGGGYGSTGCSVSAAGVLQCNGAATTDGALTAGSAVIGGGYGSTGCTLSTAGVLQCNGAATIDGALTATGALAANGGISGSAGNVALNGNVGITGTLQVSSTLTGPAEGSVVYNTYVRKTVANINSGFTLVTVPAGLKFRLVNAIATVYGGGNCGSNTSIDIKANTTVLVSYAQAQLVRSTPLVIGATGVTVLADDASFVQQAADQDITVVNVGTAVDTCTGVDFNVSYALEP